MKRRFSLIVLLIGFMLSFFVGCSPKGDLEAGNDPVDSETAGLGSSTGSEGQSGEKTRVKAALVVMSTASEYWLTIEAGCLKALDEIYGEGNYEWIYTGPSGSGDVAKQVDIIYNLIESDVDMIMVVPINPDSLVEPIEAAMEAGIATVVIDCRLNSDNIVTYVATDNLGASKAGMEKAVEMLEEAGILEGSVSIINAPVGFPSNDARTEGASEIINSTVYKLLEVQYGSNQAECMSRAENVITAHGDELVLMFGGFDRGSIGAIQAIENAGIPDEDLVFVAYDVNPDLIKYLENGLIDIMIAQQPYQQGYIGIQSAHKWLNGETLDRIIYSPTTIITQDNMSDEDVQAVMYPMGKDS